MAKVPERFIDFDAAASRCGGEDTLIRALRDGQLTGWFRSFGSEQDAPLSPKAWDELWPGVAHLDDGTWQAYELVGEPTGMVMIGAAELEGVLASAPVMSINKGGSPPKYDWDQFWIEVAMVANMPDGIPKSQADLVRHMADWCETAWGEQPSDSTLKSRLKPLYDKLKARRPSGQ